MSLCLKGLGNHQLINSLKRLVKGEREITLRILDHINEVERRKLHVEMAYSTLFVYLRDALGYSEPAASRRTKAARCLRRFPQVRGMLKKGELSLSVLCRLESVLSDSNADELLRVAKGKPVREVEKIVLRVKGVAVKAVRDEVKPVFVAKSVKAFEGGGLFGSVVNKAVSAKDVSRSAGSHVNAAVGLGCAPSVESVSEVFDEKHVDFRQESQEKSRELLEVEERYSLKFSGSKEFMEKVDYAKGLLSGKYSGGVGMEVLFSEALDLLIEAKCPKRRLARRKKRAEKKRRAEVKERVRGKLGAKVVRRERTIEVPRKESSQGGQQQSVSKTDARTSAAGSKLVSAKRSRHIPAAVRDAVMERDGYRCTFVSADGRRCCETKRLQLDHVVCWSLGGSNDPDNLRVLCQKHNLHAAEKVFGRDYMASAVAHKLNNNGKREGNGRSLPCC